MQAARQAAALLLAGLMAAPAPAFADGPRAPDARVLATMVQQHAALQEGNRLEIRRTLTRPEVRALAGRVGVNVELIGASLDTLGPNELARAADTARQINQQLDRQLVGGESTITLSTTTVIIGLLVLILLIVALR